jgi:hypothetical protein
MIRRYLTLAALLAPLVVPVRPALAACDVTPFIGAMIPANTMYMQTTGSTAYIRMQTHTVYGLSLGTSLTQKIGGELVLGTGTGKMEIVGGTTTLALGSTLFFADLRGRVRLMGGDQSQLSAVLGVGYTDFNVGLFDLAHETDQGTFIGRLTGVAGAEVHGDLSDRVHLNVTVVDRVHDQGVGLNLGGVDISKKTQNDIVATAGLTFAL